MLSSRRVDARRLGHWPGRRAWRAPWVLLAVIVAAACGTEGPTSSSPPSPMPTRLWSYEEVVARTGERIQASAWPAGFTPTGPELIGPEEAGPPGYHPGFDESRVGYDRMCAWWLAWRQSHRWSGAKAASALVTGLDGAVADFAALDQPGAPIKEHERALARARGGDQAALDDPAFSDMCLVGIGRWWDSRLPSPGGQ